MQRCKQGVGLCLGYTRENGEAERHVEQHANADRPPCTSRCTTTAAGACSEVRLPRGGALHAYAPGATANRTCCGRDCAALGPADVPASGKLTLPLLAGASCLQCDRVVVQGYDRVPHPTLRRS